MRPVVRGHIIALAVASVALTGCSGVGAPDTAAVVNGTVISQSAAQTVAEQINEAFHPQNPLTTADAVSLLIRAPYVNAYAAEHGQQIHDTVALEALQGLDEPAIDATVEVLKADGAVQNLTQQDKIALSKTLQGLDVTVNPRYGAYDPERAIVAEVTPNWLNPAPRS